MSSQAPRVDGLRHGHRAMNESRRRRAGVCSCLRRRNVRSRRVRRVGRVDGPPKPPGALPETRATLVTRPTSRPRRSRTWSDGTLRAQAVDRRGCGDLAEIPPRKAGCTSPTVLDLAGRRLAGSALGEHRDSAARQSGAVHGRAAGRRRRRRRDLPLRQAPNAVGDLSRPGLPSTGCDPIDGPGRLSARRRRSGELQLDPRARAIVPPPASKPRTRPAGRLPGASTPRPPPASQAAARCSHRMRSSRGPWQQPGPLVQAALERGGGERAPA